MKLPPMQQTLLLTVALLTFGCLFPSAFLAQTVSSSSGYSRGELDQTLLNTVAQRKLNRLVRLLLKNRLGKFEGDKIKLSQGMKFLGHQIIDQVSLYKGDALSKKLTANAVFFAFVQVKKNQLDPAKVKKWLKYPALPQQEIEDQALLETAAVYLVLKSLDDSQEILGELETRLTELDVPDQKPHLKEIKALWISKISRAKEQFQFLKANLGFSAQDAERAYAKKQIIILKSVTQKPEFLARIQSSVSLTALTLPTSVDQLRQEIRKKAFEVLCGSNCTNKKTWEQMLVLLSGGTITVADFSSFCDGCLPVGGTESLKSLIGKNKADRWEIWNTHLKKCTHNLCLVQAVVLDSMIENTQILTGLGDSPVSITKCDFRTKCKIDFSGVSNIIAEKIQASVNGKLSASCLQSEPRCTENTNKLNTAIQTSIQSPSKLKNVLEPLFVHLYLVNSSKLADAEAWLCKEVKDLDGDPSCSKTVSGTLASLEKWKNGKPGYPDFSSIQPQLEHHLTAFIADPNNEDYLLSACQGKHICKTLLVKLLSHQTGQPVDANFILYDFFADYVKTQEFRELATKLCIGKIKCQQVASLLPLLRPLDRNDVEEFLWQSLTQSENYDPILIASLGKLRSGDNRAVIDYTLEYIKEKKPFTTYCTQHPHCAVEKKECKDEGEDEGKDTCQSQYAFGVLLQMLEDIPAHLTYQEDSKDYVLNLQTYMPKQIKRIEDIHFAGIFSLYFGIGKSRTWFHDTQTRGANCTTAGGSWECIDGLHDFYHDKIGVKVEVPCLSTPSTWNSPVHFKAYTSGFLYNLSEVSGPNKEFLPHRQLLGLEFGSFVREIVEVNAGFQTFSDPNQGQSEWLFNINLSVPLTDYLSEVIDY